MARAFRRRGATVLVASRDEQRVARARDEGLDATVCDVTNDTAVQTLFESHQAFDVVVFSSAVSGAPEVHFGAGMVPISAATIRAELATNVQGLIVVAQCWLSRRTSRGGTFVTVGSPAAFAPSTSLLYSTTKGAAHTFTRGLRYQLRGTGLRVVEVLPPAVDTALNPMPIAKMNPDLVGERAVQGVVAGRDVVYVGPTWVVSLLARLSPQLAMWMVDRATQATG